MKITYRILSLLQRAPMTTREVASVLGLGYQNAKSAVNNLMLQGCLQPCRSRPSTFGRAQYVYRFVRLPRANHRPRGRG